METDPTIETFISSSPTGTSPEKNPNSDYHTPLIGLSTSLPAKAHYDSVKMKYFQSLGMAKHPTGSTTSSPAQADGNSAKSRDSRSKTLNIPHSEKLDIPINIPNKNPTPKKRATSHPIPIKRDDPTVMFAATVDTFHFDMDFDSEEGSPAEEHSLSNNSRNSSVDDFSEDSFNKEAEDDSLSPGKRNKKKFIPPHEMVATNDDFNVGTARSVARWESHRRREMLSSN